MIGFTYSKTSETRDCFNFSWFLEVYRTEINSYFRKLPDWG